MTSALAPGFQDPVFQSQSAFRNILNALSFPGEIQNLDTNFDTDVPLPGAMAAVALTLFDLDTVLWLQPDSGDHGDGKTLRRWLGFHTNAPMTSEPGDAAFAVITDIATMPALSAFAPGLAQYPEQATTLVIDLPTFSGGDKVNLTGPGIAKVISVEPPLPDSFWRQWQDNHAQYPLGVDVILTSGRALMGLPRSVRVED